jgi:hypothetical protein
LITVSAKKNSIEFQVNGKVIDSIEATNIPGNWLGIGLAVNDDTNGLPRWALDNLKIWDYEISPTPFSTMFFGFGQVKLAEESGTVEPINNKIFELTVSNPEPIPLKMGTILLLDQSFSLALSRANYVQRLTLDFILSFAPPNDYIGLTSFANDAQIDLPLSSIGDVTSSQSQRIYDLRADSVQAANNTDFAIALNIALDQFRTASDLDIRKVILITDGMFTGQDLTQIQRNINEVENILNQMKKEGITVDVLFIKDDRYINSLENISAWQEFAAKDLLNYAELQDQNELSGIIFDMYYRDHVGKPTNNTFTFITPGEFDLTIPERSKKVAMIIRTTDKASSDQPISIKLDMVDPHGQGKGVELIHDQDIIIYNISEPEAGVWKFKINSEEMENIENTIVSQTYEGITVQVQSIVLLTIDK